MLQLPPLTSFTQTMIWGKGGVPISELFDAERMSDRATQVYNTYAAQAINAIFNNETSSSNDPAKAKTLTGTFVSLNHTRLIQNAVSTRILEAILAILFICGVVAYTELCIATKGTRRLLPKNPNSIAAVASYLARSDFVSENVIPRGTECLSRRELARRRMFDGYLFSLGWGGTENETERFGIDIGRAKGGG